MIDMLSCWTFSIFINLSASCVKLYEFLPVSHNPTVNGDDENRTFFITHKQTSARQANILWQTSLEE